MEAQPHMASFDRKAVRAFLAAAEISGILLFVMPSTAEVRMYSASNCAKPLSCVFLLSSCVLCHRGRGGLDDLVQSVLGPHTHPE